MAHSSLVTLQAARDHLRLNIAGEETDAAEDIHLEILLSAAERNVLNYVKVRVGDRDDWVAEVNAWTCDTVPEDVKLAIYCLFGHYYRRRGDDFDDDQHDNPKLPGVVRSLLWKYRDPVMA